jgi:hypothetical protein
MFISIPDFVPVCRVLGDFQQLPRQAGKQHWRSAFLVLHLEYRVMIYWCCIFGAASWLKPKV